MKDACFVMTMSDIWMKEDYQEIDQERDGIDVS